jgi:hypothetical protein
MGITNFSIFLGRITVELRYAEMPFEGKGSFALTRSCHYCPTSGALHPWI